MFSRGSGSRGIVKFSVLFASCVIVYQAARTRIIDALQGTASESLKKWKQGPDVYMRSLGYEFEWQQFRTSDGVNIKMHHFWKGRNNETGIPVLFHPTTLSNGDTWLVGDPNDSFSQLLANCGYDIWIANYRGTRYSPYKRENISLTIDDNIREDLPGAIDYVLEKTGRKKLHLHSYSKGTTVSFGLLSSRPEYNQKVRMHVAIVPVTFIEDPPLLLKSGLSLFGFLSQEHTWLPWTGRAFIKRFDSNWFLEPKRWENMALASQMVTQWIPSLQDLFINFALTLRFSLEPTFSDENHMAMITHSPAGDVLNHHEVYHSGQHICTKRFQSFNFSQVPEEYRRNFSVVTYDMSQITAPTLILEASREIFSQPKDYQRIRAQHKNLIGAYRVKLPNYMHHDGAIGKNRNSIFGRAFASEMLKFDGDEMNSTCKFDLVEDYKNLEKMEVDSVAETPDASFLDNWLSWLLGPLVDDFCKYLSQRF